MSRLQRRSGRAPRSGVFGQALAVLLLVFGFAATPARAQDSLSQLPGYVDFGNLAELSGATPTVEISLGQALIGFVAAAAREEEPDLAMALSRLKSIRVNVLELSGDAGLQSARERADAIVGRLKADRWEPAVSVLADDASVQMYIKTEGDQVTGMTVMMVGEDNEAVFMNIVGEIDPEQLGRVASRFGVNLD